MYLSHVQCRFYIQQPPLPPLDNNRVMVIVWRLRRNIIRTAVCWIVRHNVRSQQHTYMSSSYRSNRLGLSHWDPYAVRRGGCLELYYCNMVEWFWWDSSLISTTNWFPSVLWHCWFGHLACKKRPRDDLLCVEWDVKPYTLTHHDWKKVSVASIFTHAYKAWVVKNSKFSSHIHPSMPLKSCFSHAQNESLATCLLLHFVCNQRTNAA